MTRFAAASAVLEVVLSIGALWSGLVLIVAPRGKMMPLPPSALADFPFES